MKFLKTYAICLVLLAVFVFFGGWMLFDLSGHFWLAIAAIAFVLAIALRMWSSTEHRVDALEEELRELKKQIDPEHSESEDTVP